MCAQHKLQRAFLEIFSKLISTFSALVHLDPESPKGPFFIRPLRVRCTIRTSWHLITFQSHRHNYYICYFHGTLISRFHFLLAKRTLSFQSSCAIAFWASFSGIPRTYRASTIAFGTGNHPIFCTFIVPSGHEIHLF
jgi:hypothetical protein